MMTEAPAPTPMRAPMGNEVPPVSLEFELGLGVGVVAMVPLLGVDVGVVIVNVVDEEGVGDAILKGVGCLWMMRCDFFRRVKA